MNKQAEIPIIMNALPDDWTARCGVCENKFAIRAAHSKTKPAASFCPDCCVNGLVAPGVLNWVRRIDLEPKWTQGRIEEGDQKPVA